MPQNLNQLARNVLEGISRFLQGAEKNEQKLRVLLVVYTLGVVVLNQLFSLGGVLFAAGALVGFHIVFLEQYVLRVVGGGMGRPVVPEEPVEPTAEQPSLARAEGSVFRTPLVLAAYLALAFFMLVTNRSALGAGVLLGFGLRYFLELALQLKNLYELRRLYFWQYAAVTDQYMKGLSLIYLGAFVVITVFAI